MPDINQLTATEALLGMDAGTLSAEALVQACLDRVERRDPQVRAWSWLAAEAALAAARAADRERAAAGSGVAVRPLLGLPVGVKDVIDTADMPTQHNSPLFAGSRPGVDAPAVAMLRAAGAIVLGKTDTTEFAAAGRDAATANPHRLTHTPGGSSSGSAAAVADFQVPLALATQTGGSTIRPASFCGIYAMKPSWGVVSREGLKHYAVSLDTLGWYGRSVADLGLLAGIYGLESALPPKTGRALHIGLCRTPMWPHAEPWLDDALAAAAVRLRAAGMVVDRLELPEAFSGLSQAHRVILMREGQAAFRSLRSHGDDLHDDFHARIENRQNHSRRDLLDAYDLAALCRPGFDAIAAGFDVVIAPSAPGEAPAGRGPGNPVFNAMWTLLHVPCINVPFCNGPSGLPVGMTLVAARLHDSELLGVAHAIDRVFAGATR